MPSITFLVWLLLLATLFLALLVLVEVSRSNSRREHEVMFGTEDFNAKCRDFGLSDKECHTMEKLVRRSTYSNKDALFNSAELFESAVNRFYEFRNLGEIREITLESVSKLRRQLGFTVANKDISLVSTRQLERGIQLRVEDPDGGEIQLKVYSINEKRFTLESPTPIPMSLMRGSKLKIRWTRPGDAVYTIHAEARATSLNRITFDHQTDIEKFQLRRWVREEVDFEMRALLDSGKVIFGRLLDLSAGGILLGLPEQLPEGSELSISFNLPSFGPETVRIKILRGLSRKNEHYPSLNLLTASFVGEFGHTQEKILQYVFELRRRQRGTMVTI